MSRLRVLGACPHDCPDTCGIVTEVEDGRAVRVTGNADNPITRGWLCAKVRPYLEHVYHPDRLQFPLRRVGPKGGGKWQRVSWNEALGEIVERWQAIISEYGAEAILPYSYSGTLGLVQMGVASARLWNRLGASQLQRSICGAAAEFAVEATLGARRSPPYADVIHSKLVIVWGHNPISTAPHFMPFLRKAQHAGCRLVVIDPRHTATARGADLHLAPLPGSDGALALGLGQVIVAEGLHDERWLETHTVGWPQFRQRLSEYPPERVARLTGLEERAIVSLAREYGNLRPGLIKFADGINRNRNGGQNVRAICALPALTGQYGTRGGGLSYSTSGTIKWNTQAVHHWGGCPPPGRAVNMNRLGAALLGEITNPPIQALFVFGANPVASTPNAGKIVEGLKREDLFTVVHELFLTDTADWADIVLPATSQLEQTDLHKAYGQTLLTYNHQAIAPLGECKSNWEVMGLLATGLGFHEPWLHQSVDEVIEEILTVSAATQPAFHGITLDRLKAEGAVPLTVEDVPFVDGQFPTPSGKVELFSQRLEQAGLDPLPGSFDDSLDEDGPGSLAMVSGATHHFVSSSLGSQAGLRHGEGAPMVEIHPTDALERNINDGDAVEMYNDRGSVRLQAAVTPAVRPGVVVSPKGHWAKHNGGRNVNWTTTDALGDLAGQSTFHSTRVWLRKG
jgi:anaerobic selenocysteine-containing dehydrogenase